MLQHHEEALSIFGRILRCKSRRGPDEEETVNNIYELAVRVKWEKINDRIMRFSTLLVGNYAVQHNNQIEEDIS